MGRFVGRFGGVPEWVLRLNLSPNAITVYATLAVYSDNEGLSWPSRAKLVLDTGMSLSTLDRASKELVDAGCLERRMRGRRGGGISSCDYELPRERRTGADRRQNQPTSLITHDSLGPTSLIMGDNLGAPSLSSDPDPVVQPVAQSATDGAILTPIKAVLSTFATAWKSRYGREYQFERDGKGISGKVLSLAKRLGYTYVPDELKGRVERFIASNDRIYVDGGHAFGLFASLHDRFSAPADSGPRYPTYDEIMARRAT